MPWDEATSVVVVTCVATVDVVVVVVVVVGTVLYTAKLNTAVSELDAPLFGSTRRAVTV